MKFLHMSNNIVFSKGFFNKNRTLKTIHGIDIENRQFKLMVDMGDILTQ